jgi:hypothetical protein
LSDEEIKQRKIDSRSGWYNETWQPHTLTRYYTTVKNIIKNRKLEKATVWNLGNLQMMGYSKEFLMTTPREDYDMDLFKQRKSKTYSDYYKMLMGKDI